MIKEDKKTQTKVSELKTYPEAKIPVNDVEKGVFADDFTLSCLVSGGADHFVLDVTLKPPPGKIELLVSRIILAPLTLKLLYTLLDTAIKSYEKDHGEMKLPEHETLQGTF